MRLLYPGVGACALVVALAGCSGDPSTSGETVLTMPASPSPAPGMLSAPAPDDAPATAEGTPTDGREPGTAVPSDPSAHCVIVAGGITTAMLAPLSLRSTEDHEQLVALEQQILDLRDKVPTDLHDDFTILAHSVEAPPEGSGTFDEKAFRRAMVPVEEWLGRHCARS